MSVIVATRDRREDLTRALASLLAMEGDGFEVVVVDQGEPRDPTRELAALLADDRVTHRPMDSPGLSAARNEGVAISRGSIIAMTDDDCEVPPGWAAATERVFEANRSVGMIFGTVRPGPFDGEQGIVPAYVHERPAVARRPTERNRVDGIGACMAFRRELWERIGGFDELLGAGARFAAGEEGDFALRALQAGFEVMATPEVELVHHGFRTWEEAANLVPRYWRGTGAMFAKNLRLAPFSTSRLLFGLAVRWCGGKSSLTRSLGAPASRTRRLFGFVRGFAEGLVHPVDGVSGCFERPGDGVSSRAPARRSGAR